MANEMRILGLTKYGARAASTRQRLSQYGPYLSAHGMGITLDPLLDDHYLLRLANGATQSRTAILSAYARRARTLSNLKGFDAVWLQYEFFPYVPVVDGLVARAAKIPIIYDIDDAIFHMYDAHPSGIVRQMLGGKLRPIVESAAICVCGNEYLAEYVISAGGKAVVVPTVVNTEQIEPIRLRDENRPLTVGWIGSPSTWRYVEPLLPALLPALARLRARFRVVGAGPAAQGFEGIDAIDWSEASEVSELQQMDIGLMPVPDEPWARGKCGYKLIQYMACGIPSVASPVGVNRNIIDHGTTGFLARTEADWLKAISMLANDHLLRAQMGKKGRTKAVADYSLHSQQPAILRAFREAMEIAA